MQSLCKINSLKKRRSRYNNVLYHYFNRSNIPKDIFISGQKYKVALESIFFCGGAAILTSDSANNAKYTPK